MKVDPRPVEGLSVAFDLETADSEKIWSYGPEFIRIGGYATGPGVRITTDIDEIKFAIHSGQSIVGHNIMSFDLLAIAHWHGLDVWELLDRDAVRDTMMIAFLEEPPSARMNQGHINKFYSLDQVSDRVLMKRKHTTDGEGTLKKLAREYGGYDRIPVDDPRYRLYLEQDVELTRDVDRHLCPDGEMTPYARREHQIAGIAAQISLNGFRVDPKLVSDRYEAGQEKKRKILDWLVSEHGLPAVRKDGSPSSSPQNTEAGRAAIKKAFETLGAKHMPKTPKGAWGTGKEAMQKMIEHYGSDKGKLTPKQREDVVALCETILDLNGVRTVYETVWNHMAEDEPTGDFRVHPSIALRQASGRLSFTKPGLTVMGKRGGRHVEREIFLPEDGHVIVAADLSQIDARAVAALSQDRAYMAMFEPGKDLHSEVAMRVFGTEKMREPAKIAGHGWNYGMGAGGLVKQLGIEPKVAVRFVEQMRREFPRLVEWKGEMAEIAESGMLLDNGFGRKMRPDPVRGYTQGPALMGQGCARDLMMEGLLRLRRLYPETLPMLRAIVHDEIVLSVPEEVVEDVEKSVVDALSFEWIPPGMPGARPIQVIADVGKRGVSWGDVYAK